MATVTVHYPRGHSDDVYRQTRRMAGCSYMTIHSWDQRDDLRHII
ncbi:hypothetical protein EH228_10825 [Erwinia endophytica]|nr:hypothetical protein EH228_10825 [Erwinia endophytica]